MTWCHHFPPQLPIFCSLRVIWCQNREQTQPPLSCHHVILGASIAVASTLVAKMRVPVFAGGWACEIELRQTGVICFPWRQQSWSYGVIKSGISDAHCPSQWKWQVLRNYDISVLQQVGMFFNGIACFVNLAFDQAGVPSRPDHVTGISNVTSQMKTNRSHWFQGREMRFCWMSSTTSWKYNISDCLVKPIFN